MPDATLLRTPLYERHESLGARLVPFAGYEMPVQYAGVLEETRAVRAHAGLFDVSHMGQVSVRGNRALEALQWLVTNDLSRLSPGQAQYNLLCNERGGTIDDLIVYHRAEDRAYLCVNASNRAKDVAWIREKIGPGYTVEDESETTALLALQGPASVHVMKAVGLGDLAQSLKYYWAAEADWDGGPCYVSRTGYTGEDGFELYLPSGRAAWAWNRLLEAGRPLGLVPAGLGARDVLRTEMGYPLYGHELGEDRSPLAAGLSWVIKLQKQAFIGKAALEKEAKAGPAEILRGVILSDRRMARDGYRVLDENDEPIGVVTSGVFSPHRDAPIAIAFLKKAFSGLEKCRVEIRQAAVEASVTRLPFVKSSVKK